MVTSFSTGFADREDIISWESEIVTRIPVKVVSSIMSQADITGLAMSDNPIISCTYWVMNVTPSQTVEVSTQGAVATAQRQQGTGFSRLTYLIGLVKEPTLLNQPAGMKKWAAGLAGLSRTSMLNENYVTTVWKYLVKNRKLEILSSDMTIIN